MSPDLDTELGFLISRIEAVRDRHHADTVEVKFRHEGQHEVIVPGQTGQVIDQDHVEIFGRTGGQEACQSLPIRPRTGSRFVGKNKGLVYRKSVRCRQLLAGGNLVVDALGALVFGTVPGVDRGSHG